MVVKNQIQMYKKEITAIIIAGIALLLMFTIAFLAISNHQKQKQIERTQAQLAIANQQQPMRIDTIRDSVKVYSHPIAVLPPSMLKKATDKQLYKEVGIKPRNIETQEITTLFVRDTIYLKPNIDSTYTYKDQWADFHLNLPTRQLSYNFKDSITTIVVREYKHKFLWWHWGVKGYHVKLINHNPHSMVTYHQYITAK